MFPSQRNILFSFKPNLLISLWSWKVSFWRTCSQPVVVKSQLHGVRTAYRAYGQPKAVNSWMIEKTPELELPNACGMQKYANMKISREHHWYYWRHTMYEFWIGCICGQDNTQRAALLLVFQTIASQQHEKARSAVDSHNDLSHVWLPVLQRRSKSVERDRCPTIMSCSHWHKLKNLSLYQHLTV